MVGSFTQVDVESRTSGDGHCLRTFREAVYPDSLPFRAQTASLGETANMMIIWAVDAFPKGVDGYDDATATGIEDAKKKHLYAIEAPCYGEAATSRRISGGPQASLIMVHERKGRWRQKTLICCFQPVHELLGGTYHFAAHKSCQGYSA